MDAHPLRSSGAARRVPKVGRADRLLASGLVSYALLYLSWLALRWGPADLQLALNDAAYLPLGALTVLSLERAASLAPSRRAALAWTLLALGMACFSFGDLTWFTQEILLGIEIGATSPADIGYLAFYPVLALGLLALPRDRPTSRATAILDILIVAGGAATAVWWFIIGPTVASTSTEPFETMVALAYPVGDVVLLSAVAAALLGRVRDTSPVALALLGIALTVNCFADLSYSRMILEGTYESGAWLDVAWMVGWVGVGLAGIAQAHGLLASGAKRSLSHPSFGVLPYAAIAVVCAILVISTIGEAISEVIAVAGAVVVAGLVTVRQAVTSRHNSRLLAAASAQRTEERFAAIIRNLHDVVVVVNPDGTVAWATPSIEQLVGRRSEVVVGASLASFLDPLEAPRIVELLQRTTERAEAVGPVSCVGAALGPERLELLAVNLLKDKRVGGIVVTMRDVSERHRFEEQLRSQALHDPLTGLANRVLLADRLDHAVKRAQRAGGAPALLYLDLDDFKEINDTLGHPAGDAVLVEVAERLQRSLRSGDTAARLGGDEFAVLLDRTTDLAEATAAADRLSEVLAAPITLPGCDVVVRSSIGVVRPESASAEAEDLLRNADIAMYAAKRESKGGHRVYVPEMYLETIERVRLEADLRHALARGELEVYYQPLVRMTDEVVIGVEALLRWNNPRRGLVMPDEFIPIAESCGEIRSIGRWVAEQACRTVGRWNAGRAGEALQANVNVSTRQLEYGFVDEIDEVLARTGFPARNLVLEVTEGVLAGDRTKVVAILSALRDRGVRIAIDDFGTGYSSLSYLRDLPVDELKIDRAFIRDMGSRDEPSLVEAIIALGHGMALTTTAEGIERPEQARVLRDLGCDSAQGFLLGRPGPEALIGASLDESRSRSVAS